MPRFRTITFIPRVGVNQDAITIPRGPFPTFDVRGGGIPLIDAFEGTIKAVSLGKSRVVVQGDTSLDVLRAAEIQRSASGAAKLQARDVMTVASGHCILLLTHPIGTHGNKISGDHNLFGNPYLPSPAIEIARGVIHEADRYGNTWLLLLPRNEVLRVSTVGAGLAQTNYYVFDGRCLLCRTREQRVNGDELPGFPIPRLPRWHLEKEIIGEEVFWKLSDATSSVIGTVEDWDSVTRSMVRDVDSPEDGVIVFDRAADGFPACLCNSGDSDDKKPLDVARPAIAARWIRNVLGMEVI